MTDEVRHFTPQIPAGTPQAAPAVISMAFPPRTVLRIEWRVPPGPSGKMGWQLTMGGAAVLPFPPGTWIIADGQAGEFSGGALPDSGAWQLTGYNTGTFPHTVYVTFHLAAIRRPPQLPVLIPAVLLGPVPDLSRAGPPIRGRQP